MLPTLTELMFALEQDAEHAMVEAERVSEKAMRNPTDENLEAIERAIGRSEGIRHALTLVSEKLCDYIRERERDSVLHSVRASAPVGSPLAISRERRKQR